MDLTQLQQFLLPAAILALLAWRFFRFGRVRALLPRLFKEGAILIDVRTAAEFASGHAENSINIPLDELDSKITQLDPKKTIIVCCASGTRSAVAAALLKRQGFTNVLNVGPWRNAASKP